MNNQLTKKDAQKWVNALRSGNYKQTIGKLQHEEGFCCLGVACAIFIPKDKLETEKLSEESIPNLIGGLPEDQEHAPEWLKNIDTDLYERLDGVSFTDLNDIENLSFDEIADVIELVYIHKMLD